MIPAMKALHYALAGGMVGLVVWSLWMILGGGE